MTVADKPADFADFVSARSGSMLKSAWLLTGDAGRAEDLLQTALVKAWLRWSKVGVADDPEAYVRRVMYTTYVSWWRRRWRTEIPSDSVHELGAVSDPAGQLVARDVVRRALVRLSRQQRVIVVLRYVEDRSVAETASLLGCTAATVKVQSGRALAALRQDPELMSHLKEGISA